MKYLIIDKRMRNIEKKALTNLGYQLIELEKSSNVYEEISSHVDIFCAKIKDKLIVEQSRYDYIKEKLGNTKNVIKGQSMVKKTYPYDISYNVCVLKNKAIHNFKYTDKKIIERLKEEKCELINVKQGYSKCSIAIIDDNSIITADKGIFNKLKDSEIDVLFLDYEPDIKLINQNDYSKMKGFIGGAVFKIEHTIFISGDLNKIDEKNKIKNFIKSKGLRIIDFKGLEVIDYGGIIDFN